MTTCIQRASVRNGQPFNYQDDTEEYDDVWPPPVPRSALRYTSTTDHTPVVVVGNRRYVLHSGPPPRQASNIPQDAAAPRQRRRVHPLLILGTGMLLMFTLWVLGNALVNWWNVTQDDLHYGRPRTFQIDAVVGHNDSPSHPSHFIVSNINRRIIIFELPGGDVGKAKIYLVSSLFGDGADLAVVTLRFKDVNGDGKPDMIVSVKDSTIIYIRDARFINYPG